LLKLILGRRLANEEHGERKIGAFEGVPAMGLDGLGSSSYGPEAALTVLMPLGAAGSAYIGIVMLPILALLAILYVSCRRRLRHRRHRSSRSSTRRHVPRLFASRNVTVSPAVRQAYHALHHFIADVDRGRPAIDAALEHRQFAKEEHETSYRARKPLRRSSVCRDRTEQRKGDGESFSGDAPVATASVALPRRPCLRAARELWRRGDGDAGDQESRRGDARYPR